MCNNHTKYYVFIHLGELSHTTDAGLSGFVLV